VPAAARAIGWKWNGERFRRVGGGQGSGLALIVPLSLFADHDAALWLVFNFRTGNQSDSHSPVIPFAVSGGILGLLRSPGSSMAQPSRAAPGGGFFHLRCFRRCRRWDGILLVFPTSAARPRGTGWETEAGPIQSSAGRIPRMRQVFHDRILCLHRPALPAAGFPTGNRLSPGCQQARWALR